MDRNSSGRNDQLKLAVIHSLGKNTIGSTNMDLLSLPPSTTVAPTGVAGLVGHLPMPSTRLTRAAAVASTELLQTVDGSEMLAGKINAQSKDDIEM